MSPNRKDEPKKTLRGERVYRVLSLLGVATMCFFAWDPGRDGITTWPSPSPWAPKGEDACGPICFDSTMSQPTCQLLEGPEGPFSRCRKGSGSINGSTALWSGVPTPASQQSHETRNDAKHRRPQDAHPRNCVVLSIWLFHQRTPLHCPFPINPTEPYC